MSLPYFEKKRIFPNIQKKTKDFVEGKMCHYLHIQSIDQLFEVTPNSFCIYRTGMM